MMKNRPYLPIGLRMAHVLMWLAALLTQADEFALVDAAFVWHIYKIAFYTHSYQRFPLHAKQQ